MTRLLVDLGLVVVYGLWLMLVLTLLTNSRTRRLNKAKPKSKTYTGTDAWTYNAEDWMKLAQATPDEGGCSRCGTYGPYDHVSACYRGLQMCYWCAELERTRLIVEPK